MRRSAWIFLAAILLPSLVLGWLAVRSARDQQVVLEHQQAVISQDVTDALAKKVHDQLDGSRSSFVEKTQQLLRKSSSPRTLAKNFNRELRKTWELAEVGFAVDLNGTIYSPTAKQGVMAKTFRAENNRFLGNRENVPVFSQYPQQVAVNTAQPLNNSNAANAAVLQAQAQVAPPPESQSGNEVAQMGAGQQRATENTVRSQAQRASSQQPQSANQNAQNAQLAQLQRVVRPALETQTSRLPQQQAPVSQMTQIEPVQRQVVPQKIISLQQSTISNTVPEESDFRRVIGSETTGALARFLEDKLRLMVWYRPSPSGSLIFGAQISKPELVRDLQPLVESPELQRADANYCLAILDDRGNPVALSQPGFKADWKHPFVATEIGEALPHWEAALYIVDPQQITRSASTLKLTLASIVLTLMAAILLGGWLMAADARRQMRLAQQKTDFVSNVSHELKTPLTSIRMFADMLAEGRVAERERQHNYLRIISAESARLTRLINNVLDFARIERGAPSGERRPCHLVEIAREVVDTCRPHLESEGILLALDVQAEALPLMADRDALAQVILNLLSNAEKYGGREILLRVRREELPGAPGSGCVDVLDRGPGIPLKKLEAAFQPFHRLDDSLASGVSGSGLGLTLARRMARANGGDVTYASRIGGGSCFTLKVPLSGLGRSDESATQ